MKKFMLTILACGLVSMAMAQTPEEKAALKAQKAALKAAQKEAKGQMNDGISLRDAVNLLYNTNQTERAKGEKANQELIAENEASIKSKSSEALDLLTKALASGHLEEKKLFDTYKALEDVGAQLLNPELNKAAANQPFDTLTFAKAVDAVSEGCYGVITYGNKKDEMQKPTVLADELKMPKLMTYYAYLCQFYITGKNLPGACDALDKYAAFGKKYPVVAEDEAVKNPSMPISQFAFNIYLTAYNSKDFATCEKYYELASQYSDEASHNFVMSSRPQMYKEQGDTVKWVQALKDVADKNPDSEAAETAIQNLLSIYSNRGNAELTKIADEMLAKYPNSKVTNYGKGYSLFAQEMYDEGYAYFLKSLEIDPNYANAIYMAGTCKYRNALSNYYKYIDSKKYKTQAEMNKAEETYVKSYFRDAQKHFEHLRELKPEDAGQWAGPLENIYKNIGMPEKAAEMRSLSEGL